ncbi:hypothetical protein SAY87_003796 [Trapa incisa]|uniref:C2 NT-type domain-containing protein n=1 Tax=Trapa incisa TaxID=236973 RepID=A0AAN7KS01_9MYRT|nr:hypothetical protein SAY87_003796 [Trapa incisa]
MMQMMEQCTSKLDAAMFSTILHSSDDNLLADSQPDLIIDLKVLPIPSGKLSFKAKFQNRCSIEACERTLCLLQSPQPPKERLVDHKEEYSSPRDSSPSPASPIICCLSEGTMVLGQRSSGSRNSKSLSIQHNYLIHIDYIKPWPPSPQLQYIRSALVHWENGERSSGSTRSVSPSPNSVSNGGKIEFNESFHLPVTMMRDMSIRNGNATAFQKNFLTFNLYEPRRDNILKGQLIGSAIIDLADYGVLVEPLSVNASLNCKRRFRNMAQPFLHIRIQPIEKGRVHSSSHGSPFSELTVEHDGESTSASFNEEYADETDIPSFTENDFTCFPPVNSNGSLQIEDEQVTEAFSGINANHPALEYENGTQEYHFEEGKHFIDEKPNTLSTDSSEEQGFRRNSSFSFMWNDFHTKDSPPLLDDEVIKSPPSDTVRSNQLGSYKLLMGERCAQGRKNNIICERKEAKVYTKDRKVTSMGTKIQMLERRIHQLEEELREAAALEIAIYSVMAEHGSCSAKFYSPAQRLSQLYHYACTKLSQSRRASVARSCLSGLILVARASGNDVPRLTYWLSNCAVLRATLSCTNMKGSYMIHQSLDTDDSFSREHDKRRNVKAKSTEDDLLAFMEELEKIEAWIFSRVVESIWWQILIPHMQFVPGKVSNRFKLSHGSNMNNGKLEAQIEGQIQANLSLEHWKKAFNEARERACPARAGGHACSCLPLLSRLIMEQCTSKLDAAMFNAILRSSADDFPADPQSDPITDLKVLPIPAGNLSFKAGVQLKHVTRNWSKWITDHFGTGDEDLSENETTTRKYNNQGNWFKPFQLLDALSNLMMLPKDLLLSGGSIRKEVCPTLGAPLIRRVLENFNPDEFSPNPVPEALLKALASEENTSAADEDSFTSYPCLAAQPVYLPPPVSSMSAVLKDDFLKNLQKNDVEVDELTSPLDVALIDELLSSPNSTIPNPILKDISARNALRYKLLQDIWMDSGN